MEKRTHHGVLIAIKSAALITTRDLKIGDIILSTTSAIDSAIIREGTASQYSHSALYAGFVQGSDGTGVSTRVIEAVKEGVDDPTLFEAKNKPMGYYEDWLGNN